MFRGLCLIPLLGWLLIVAPINVRADAMVTVLQEINALRREHGLSPVRIELRLTVEARAHARDMARHDYFNTRTPDGKKFESPLELVAILRSRGDGFVRALVEKMLVYALGRGLTFYDRCAIDKIVDSVVEQDYRFSVLVTEIVKSEPFRMVRNDRDHDAN